MANTNVVTNVSTGAPNADGALYRAPVGTALPTDATTALAAAYKPLGFISEEGMTNTKTIETETIKDWGGRDVLTIQSGRSDTYKCTLIEILNLDVLKTVYGDDNVSGTLADGITVKGNATELGTAVYVIELALRDGAKKRIVIPNGALSELGDVTYVKNGVAGYPITINANAGGFATDDDNFKEYIKRPAASSNP